MFQTSDLRELVQERQTPFLSFYMPTHAAGREQQQDDIRHKNLIREAETQLKAQSDIDESSTEKLIKQLKSIPQDKNIWGHRSAGLAAFAAPDFFRVYVCPLVMPEQVSVGKCFHLSPLLPLLHANGRYYLLALTKDSAELFEATRYHRTCSDLEIGGPIEIDGAEEALQLHSHLAPTQGKGGVGEALFHGQGAPDDREKTTVVNYFKRQVDPQVSQFLHGNNTPLVLACVDYLAPIYQEANTYPHLLDKHVSGNPQEREEKELLHEAWECLEPRFQKLESLALKRFGDLSSSERTLDDEKAIMEASQNGQVETIFVPIQPNGVSATSSDMAEVSHVIENSVYQTLYHGGEVMSVKQVPTKEDGNPSALAAILRY